MYQLGLLFRNYRFRIVDLFDDPKKAAVMAVAALEHGENVKASIILEAGSNKAVAAIVKRDVEGVEVLEVLYVSEKELMLQLAELLI